MPTAADYATAPLGVLKGVNLDDYRWVMLVASIMVFHFAITGFIAGSYRSKIFTEEFMKENF
jgi:hypothetical protein